MHLVVTPNSPLSSDVVRNEGCQRFRQPALAALGQALDFNPEIVSGDQTRDQLQHHDHVVTFPPNALEAERTVWSFAVPPICSVSTRFG